MSRQSLETVLQGAGNPVKLLRNSRIGAYVYPVVPIEFTNWRDEQRAWQKTAVLFDQSHHMAEFTIKGPDALKLVSYTTINSFTNFTPNKAKQMVPCSYDGYVIGDGILFYLRQGRVPVRWACPHRELVAVPCRDGRLQGRHIRDDRSPSHPRGNAVTRRHYRYQVQGPNAAKVLERLNGGPLPDVKFFTMDSINDQGTQGARLAPWHGRCAGSGDLGSVRRARRDSRSHPRGRQGFRPGAGRCARLFEQYARVRLDSIAPARGLHRREDEEVPRVAARDGL